MTTTLEGGEGSASRPGRSLPPGKTRYPLYKRLSGPQGRFGQLREISPPPGFVPRTVQPVVSRYNDWATRLTSGPHTPYIFPHEIILKDSKPAQAGHNLEPPKTTVQKCRNLHQHLMSKNTIIFLRWVADHCHYGKGGSWCRSKEGHSDWQCIIDINNIDNQLDATILTPWP